MDFADEENNTLIDQEILSGNPHLYVMKSISKSYGVPGLRLGVLASGDKEEALIVVGFLDEEAYRGPFSQNLLLANSKRVVKKNN